MQPDLSLIGPVLESFASQSVGHVSASVIAGYARRLASRVESQASTAPDEEGAQATGLHLGVIGRAFQECRSWADAANYYAKAAQWMEEWGPHDRVGSTYHQIGMVHQLQRHWEEALDNYQKAVAWKEKTGQEHELVGTWTAIGRTLVAASDFEQAGRALFTAIDALNEHGVANPGQFFGLIRLAHELASNERIPAEQRSDIEGFLNAVFEARPEIREALVELGKRDEPGTSDTSS